MGRKTFMAMVAGGLVVLLCAALAGPAEARTRKVLGRDTDLRPVNWPQGRTLTFKAGEYWIDDAEKGVQSGTLAKPYTLAIWNSNRQANFAPGFIRFERTGGVKEGVLRGDQALPVVWSKAQLTFKNGTRCEFGYDGGVMKGTLAQGATLKKQSGGQESFPAGTLIDFAGDGSVARAVKPKGSGSFDGRYQATIAITVNPATIHGFIGHYTKGGSNTASVPFTFEIKNGVLSGGGDAPGPSGGFSLQWKANVDAQGRLVNGLLTGFVHRWDEDNRGNLRPCPAGIAPAGAPKCKWIRWTVRGTITGTITKTGGSGAARVVTSDGKTTIPGQWNARKVGQ